MNVPAYFPLVFVVPAPKGVSCIVRCINWMDDMMVECETVVISTWNFSGEQKEKKTFFSVNWFTLHLLLRNAFHSGSFWIRTFFIRVGSMPLNSSKTFRKKCAKWNQRCVFQPKGNEKEWEEKSERDLNLLFYPIDRYMIFTFSSRTFCPFFVRMHHRSLSRYQRRRVTKFMSRFICIYINEHLSLFYRGHTWKKKIKNAAMILLRSRNQWPIFTN